MTESIRSLIKNAPSEAYSGQRSKFRSGDIFAQSHGSWESWNGIKVLGVRIVTLSTYSHVGVIEVGKDGRMYAVEAVRPEARRIYLSEIGPFYHLPIEQADWTAVTDYKVAEAIGTPYSQFDAIRAYFKPLPKGCMTECAALTREVLMAAGVDLGPLSRPDSVVQRALELGSSLTYVHKVPEKV